MKLGWASIMAALCLMCSQVSASTEPQGSRWLDRKEEGWFFYKDPPEKKEPEKKKVEPPPIPVVAPAPPVQKDIQPAGPAVMSTEWLRTNIPKYLDKAIDDPTPENVAAYMYLQRYAMDKSFKFMDGFEKVSMFDPIADESIRRPLANAAADRQDREKASLRAAYIEKIRDGSGLFFFFERNSLGKDMADVMDMARTSIGMEVIAIDVKGDSSPFYSMKEVLVDKGHAKRFQIDLFPAVVMVKPNHDFFVLSQGMVSLDDLLKRVSYAGVELGIITQEELDAGRGINNVSGILKGPDMIQKGRQFEGGSMPSSEDIVRMFKESNYQ